MAESEGIDGSGNTVCGNEWEFVSLTASTYASARGPKATEQDVEDKSDVSKELEDESPHALFMSQHFASLTDEKLLSEADKSQTQNTDKNFELVEEARIGANLTEKEVNLSNVAPNSLFHADAPVDEKVDCPNFTKFSDINMDVSEIYSKDDNSPGESNLPCEAWWKRQAAFLVCSCKRNKHVVVCFHRCSSNGFSLSRASSADRKDPNSTTEVECLSKRRAIRKGSSTHSSPQKCDSG